MKDNYQQKYLKYKNKYLNLVGGIATEPSEDNHILITINEPNWNREQLYVNNTDTINDLIQAKGKNTFPIEDVMDHFNIDDSTREALAYRRHSNVISVLNFFYKETKIN